MRIRIVTWNIHKGIGGLDRRYRIDRTIDLLSQQQADLIFLQEVAEHMPRSRFDDQLAMIAEALHMPHRAYAAQHQFNVGGYGNAIVSRWPLYHVHELDLTIGARKKRGALHARARLQVREGSRTLVLHNLHLGLGGYERQLQMHLFLSSHPFRGLHRSTPVIVAGDLNDGWGTLYRRMLRPNGFSRVGRRLFTFPAWLPVRALDSVFVRGDLAALSCHPARGALPRQASDHLLLVADVQLLT